MQGLNLDRKSHLEQVSWLQDEPRQPASVLAFTSPYVCPFMLCQNKDQDQGKDIKSWDLLTRLPERVFKLKGKHGSDTRLIAQDSGGNNLPGHWNFMTLWGHGGSTEVLFSAFRDSRMGYPSAAGPSCRSAHSVGGVTLTKIAPGENRSCWYSHPSRMDNTLSRGSTSRGAGCGGAAAEPQQKLELIDITSPRWKRFTRARS